ncbi:LOW QUALITY PROTEIN: growth hormone-regulated TBC protein 1-like [Pollicipes pollicipes]|uniref:LOW QUALITY PROTEIN: growth hormone-regulated TBC protein 1-like n=1 Tax=Pollicipes pollicipes TaxID=41117 RepID=UPI0018855D5E|nr:LOW QUALITY PROTEIN: growth hormone-regulated TBC protein 1-like [Pollicipes pollicipes]
MTTLSNVDEYGFERPADFDLAEYESFISGYLAVLTRRNIKWRRLLGRGKRELRQNARTKRYIRKGVPAEYRARYRQLLQGPFQPAVLEVIAADLPRTFPDNIHFRGEASAARVSLGNILRAFSKHRPNVGYCQGVNYIAGLLLLVTDREEDAFWLLAALVDRQLPDYYVRSMRGVRLDIEVFSQLVRVKLPNIYEHMQMLGIAWSMIATKWFVCLFAEVLPVETLFRVWDCLFYEGTKVLFRVGLTLLKLHETRLLACRDFMETMTALRDLPRSPAVLQCHSFMESVFRLPDPFSSSLVQQTRAKCTADLERQDAKIK